jgi:aminoglycoside/choline kinase family phosphotransferase
MRAATGGEIEIVNIDQTKLIAIGRWEFAQAKLGGFFARDEANGNDAILQNDFVREAFGRLDLVFVQRGRVKIDRAVNIRHVERNGRHVEKAHEGSRKHVLGGVLLHVISAANCVDFAPHARARIHIFDWRFEIVDDFAVLGVNNFGHSEILRCVDAGYSIRLSGAGRNNPAGIVNLPSARRIKRGAIENQRRPGAIDYRAHLGVELVKKGIVIVEAIGHFSDEFSIGMPWPNIKQSQSLVIWRVTLERGCYLKCLLERHTTMDVLGKLFEEHFRVPPSAVKALQGELGGSGRRIIRLSTDKVSAIGILYGVQEENVAFLKFSNHFRRYGLPVPEIYGEDLDQGAYLEEDFGDVTLFDFLSSNRTGDNIASPVVEAYRKVVAILPRFQIEAGRDLDYSACYPRASFDRQSIAWDLNYFKYYFLRLAGIPFNEQALEDDFERLTNFLLSADGQYFLYRDFQSRNIMLRGGNPFFLDYQGGRKGALQYDIASLLYDAKADLPPQLRQELLDLYVEQAGELTAMDREAFLKYYYAYVYVRILQALGAYGFRGFYERKSHFLQSVPYALKNLRWLLHNVKLPIELPTLMSAFNSMLASEKLQSLAHEGDHLTVRIMSFSFHRGLPKDESGHGGGFVFDGRSLPNPGREERFKALTGKDAPVIDYLNQQESVHQFLASVMSLVDASVANYQQRGFKSLMVSFGCTGGQHRSVYLAEQLAKRLRERNGVEVVVRHRELEGAGEASK